MNTTQDLASDIRHATSEFDLDEITEENGFPPIVFEYFEDEPLIEDYFDLMADDRWDYREDNPEVEAALVKWRGYKKISTALCEALVNEFVKKYDIPRNAIPALVEELEVGEPTGIEGYLQQLGRPTIPTEEPVPSRSPELEDYLKQLK